jgi:hypothetical protein
MIKKKKQTLAKLNTNLMTECLFKTAIASYKTNKNQL